MLQLAHVLDVIEGEPDSLPGGEQGLRTLSVIHSTNSADDTAGVMRFEQFIVRHYIDVVRQ